jgi:RHS repeat-associated protein
VLEEHTDWTLERSFVIGADVIGQGVGVSASYFGYDGRGSTRLLTDSAGAVVAGAGGVFDYDAFGNAIGFDPDMADTPLLFNGEWWDAASDRYHLRARDYDPGLGRFPSRDVYEAGVGDLSDRNLYNFVDADPVNKWDPTGMFFSLIDQLATHATALSQQAARAGPGIKTLTMTQRFHQAMRVVNSARRVWDTVSWAREAMSLAEFSVAERAAFRAGLEAFRHFKLHAKTPPVSISIPRSIVQKIRKNAGPWFETTAMQAMVGALFAALVVKLLDWDTTSIEANYTGVDGIFNTKKGLYAVVEAKGGSGRLAKHQMTDKWIEKKLDKAIREKSGADSDNLRKLQSNGPLIAVVISTELRGSDPKMRVQMQTYKGIQPWAI